MTELVLNDRTRQQLEHVITYAPHALVLSAPVGMGKATLAEWLAAKLLGVSLSKTANHPYIKRITPEDGKAISIETVRLLEHTLSLKTASSGAVNRVIIIQDAHAMTTEAQNALLKTLEEPPAGTVLILTSANQHALLPTVRSRVQIIEISRPANDVLRAELESRGSTNAEAAKILALSDGLPGLSFALADNDTSHPLVAAVGTARELLQAPMFGKLQKVDALAKNRQNTEQVLTVLQHMAHAALLRPQPAARWRTILQAAYDAQAALIKGGQPKLVLTNLMLNL